jgi:hypothetical protein
VWVLGGVVVGAVLGFLFQRAAEPISRRELWSDRASETLADVELLLIAADARGFANVPGGWGT